MELVAVAPILQGLLTIVYPERGVHVEAFSYPFEEQSCDTMGVDMLMIIYQLDYVCKLNCCGNNHIKFGIPGGR